eukprot:1196308-Prorocentrum_minimum.AAC.2
MEAETWLQQCERMTMGGKAAKHTVKPDTKAKEKLDKEKLKKQTSFKVAHDALVQGHGMRGAAQCILFFLFPPSRLVAVSSYRPASSFGGLRSWVAPAPSAATA